MLQLYYYDFKRKFTTYIDIRSSLHQNSNVWLYIGTTWIEPCHVINDPYHLDSVIIKDSNIYKQINR